MDWLAHLKRCSGETLSELFIKAFIDLTSNGTRITLYMKTQLEACLNL